MKAKIRRQELVWEWRVEHAGQMIKSGFKKAIDAWEWAMWNYKGIRCFRLKSLSYWRTVEAINK